MKLARWDHGNSAVTSRRELPLLKVAWWREKNQPMAHICVDTHKGGRGGGKNTAASI